MDWLRCSVRGIFFLLVAVFSLLGMASAVVFHMTASNQISAEQVADGVNQLQTGYTWIMGGNALGALLILGRYSLPEMFNRLLDAAITRRESKVGN